MTTAHEAWLAMRPSHYCASEWGQGLGFSTFGGPVKVWAGKEGPGNHPEPKPEVKRDIFVRGHVCEGPLLTWLSDYLGMPIYHNTDHTVVHAVEKWASCTPDGYVLDGEPLVPIEGAEAKTSTIRRGWGEHGDEALGLDAERLVPYPDYAIQVNASLWITNLPVWQMVVGIVPYGSEITIKSALARGCSWDQAAGIVLDQSDKRAFTIYRDPNDEKALVDMARSWWFKHVVGGVQPEWDGSKAARVLLAKRHHEMKLDQIRRATPSDEAFVRRLKAARIEEWEAIETVARLKQEALHRIGGHRGIETREGRLTTTRKTSKTGAPVLQLNTPKHWSN